MKTTGTRSLILYILMTGFLCGLVLFLFSYQKDGGTWALQRFNKHLSQGAELSFAGNVTDRAGEILAYSKDGQRLYHADQTVRLATLHALGDTHGYISTGVQNSYRAELSGYNMITGLTSPTGKSTGNNVKLTLNAALCKLALQKFNGLNGAAALYNYKTGEILCMVSTPGFDPAGDPPKDSGTDGIYLNRVLSASYTPGSIFKLVTSAAAIENIADLRERTFTCEGFVTVNGEKINCLKKHGKINFETGLSKSCNVVFAELGMELGKEKLTAQAEKMGFGKSFELDGIPTSKSAYNVADADDNGLAWSAIGQYTDLTNPYHMMLLMGAIANSGTAVQPYLIQSITTSAGIPVKTGHTVNGPALVDPLTAEELKTLMRHNVTAEYGDKLFPGMQVCAKTGTAEVGGGKKPNGWIVGFNQDETVPLAFAVVVEGTDSGIGSAGKIASAMMQAAQG